MSKGIGIIGCGKIAQIRHIPEFAQNPDATIIGYYNPTCFRAEDMAARYGGKVYPDITAMLDDPRIDAVVISLANKVHAEVTIQALRAGKDVLCEKPMATTIEDCEAMVREAEKAGRLLLIAQNQRLTQAHRAARKMIAEGAIGKVLTFRTTFGHSGPENWSINPGKGTWFFSRDAAVMGVMADLGIHKTDLIQYLLGRPVVGVSALLTTLDKTGEDGRPIGVDDNALCLFRMAGGVVGTMTASWTYYGQEDNSTIIYGTEGILRIYDDPACALQWIRKDGSAERLDVESIQTNDNQTASGVADAFVDALNTRDEGLMSARRVLPAMRAVFAAIRSSEQGCYVPIPENGD